ncbi:MAG TPA: RIP metalloprotease RseP, partial [Tichowtungia sp.]|nr:RIP metalloprotease RseP [Tichowtungia sp.]
VLAADYGVENTVAEAAGVRTGDHIIALDGTPVETFRDIQTIIGQSAQEELSATIQRDGETIRTTLQPALDPSSGAGRIGVYPWIEPVIAEVTDNSAASLAGLRPGDEIVAVNGEPVANSIAVERAISTSGSDPIKLSISRDGATRDVTVVPDYGENDQPRLGIRYEMVTHRTPSYGLFGGLVEGGRQAIETLQLTLRGIGLLFRGVDLNQALMGPVRITYMVGEVATVGFQGGIGRAVLSFFNFLSLISITLFFMNLLPIPVLDGGQILLSAIELTSRKPLHPRFVYHYQMVGNVIILALMFFALFNDILFFARG